MLGCDLFVVLCILFIVVRLSLIFGLLIIIRVMRI